MKKIYNGKNIVIVTHKVVHLCDDDLVTYLNSHKFANILHIMHSFANAKDRQSKFIWYKEGKLYKHVETQDFSYLPEPFIYIKEMYFTVKWVLEAKIYWRQYIGLDGLCVSFGNLLKLSNKVEKTCYWVIDFVPYNRFSSVIKNYIYHFINRTSFKNSDEVWDLSPRMGPARVKYLNISKKDIKSQRIVPIGAWIKRIKKIPYERCDKNTLIFVGNISQYQGVQLIINIIPDIIKLIPNFNFKIIGSGDYGSIVKELANKKGVLDYCTFLGQIDDHVELEKEIARSAVAIAPYLKEMKHISYYADPSKIKIYLACGVPIILTDIPWNASKISERKCGIIVEEDKKSILNAIQYLFKSDANKIYRKNAIDYAKSFDYNNIFDKIYNEVLNNPQVN